ncbi:MAG: alpha/beta hydrolase [Parcubacteria group bacterium]|nr:alpha/beta hydrolase [Parcubacteria group bacterium]MCR4342451.1 alpha/beta hydrolase [Patescibacteria group bacterium]
MSSFEEQFLKREEIRSPGGFVKVVDINFDDNTTPVLLSSGWGETLEALKSVVFSIAKITGRRVFACDYAHLDNIKGYQDGFPASGYMKAHSFINLLDEKQVNKVDAIGHSEGAINVIIAAYLKPEKFKNIILINPSGMMHNDSFRKLVKRFLSETLFEPITIETTRKFLIYVRYVFRVVGYILRNPIQAFREAIGISRFKIFHLLRNIQKNGVKVAIVVDKNDIIFPVNQVRRQAKKAKVKDFYLVEGGHNEIHINPDKFIETINKIFISMGR